MIKNYTVLWSTQVNSFLSSSSRNLLPSPIAFEVLYFLVPVSSIREASNCTVEPPDATTSESDKNHFYS